MTCIIGKSLVSERFSAEDFKDNPSVLKRGKSIIELAYRVNSKTKKRHKSLARAPKRLNNCVL